tara:strand:+ start:1366 stop:2154 length:789 start_codon:yes stop_codon:yes gene_type:complete
MKIAIYYSGCIRSLKHVVKHNIDVIRNSIGDCEIHTFYSFWDVTDKPVEVPDKWCVPISEYGFDRFKEDPTGELESKSQNNFVSIESEDEIKKWLIESGSDYVDGEIESIDISKKIIEESKFFKRPKLTSQYYKIHRVAEKYSSEKFDYCVRIRGDVMINSFPDGEDLSDPDLESFLLINEYMWPNGRSHIGGSVNEMIWCSTSNIFLDTCSVHLPDSEGIFNDSSGETVTARHFQKLLDDDVVKLYAYFNFNHRTLRFTKK